MNNNILYIYTDGSSKGNPGEGGFAFVVTNEEQNFIIYYDSMQVDYITNNQAELNAVLNAIKYAELNYDKTFIIYSDSNYVVQTCNEWCFSWAANGWTKGKQHLPIENLELIQEIHQHLKQPFPNYQIAKVGGHRGIVGNEAADMLAKGKSIDSIIQKFNIGVNILSN